MTPAANTTRLWRINPGAVPFGEDEKNFVAIHLYNDVGAGDIPREPVRLGAEGQSPGMPFPYEFVRSRYTPCFYYWAC